VSEAEFRLFILKGFCLFRVLRLLGGDGSRRDGWVIGYVNPEVVVKGRWLMS